jgi:hypothetical protein
MSMKQEAVCYLYLVPTDIATFKYSLSTLMCGYVSRKNCKLNAWL